MTALRRVRMEAGHWAILLAIFWQWRDWFMSAIASDDVIIAASGLRLQSEPGTILPLEIGLGSTASAHFLPLGGVLTGCFLWLALTLWEHTSMSLQEAWGLLAWISMVMCWRVTSHFVVRLTGTTRAFLTTLSIGVLGGLLMQIPGDLNLNAVLSFPVAGWITTSIAIWTVTAVLDRNGQITVPFVFVLSSVVIMIYELLILPILCATLSVIVLNRFGVRRAMLLLGSSCAALLIPFAHRVYYALWPSTAAYSGTTLNASRNFAEGVWAGVMSSASALPLGQMAPVAQGVEVDFPVFSFYALALACTASAVLLSKIDPNGVPNRLKIGVLILAFSALGGGAVLGGTTKYSVYFSAAWGRTYLNFLLATVTVVVATYYFGLRVVRTAPGRLFSLGLLFVLGSVHASANVSMVDRYRDHWAWAKEALEDVVEETDDVILCRHYRTIASQPLPNVYSKQLISQIDQFRQARFGKGMCSSFDDSRIIAFRVSGEVVKPEHHDSGSWWWLTGNSFEIDVSFLDAPPESISVVFGSSPCGVPLSVQVGTEPSKAIGPNSGPTPLRVPLGSLVYDGRGMWSTTLDGRVSGAACLLDVDQRTLVAPIHFPTQVTTFD